MDYESLNISINIPSYKRPYVETLDYIKHDIINVWIDKKEEEEYMKANNDHHNMNLCICDKGIQGNIARVRNYILDKEFENGADVVIILDDDMRQMGYWEKNKAVKIDSKDLRRFLIKFTVLCNDLGANMFGLCIAPDKQNYREYTPINTKHFIGGPFQGFINNAGGLRYDERMPLKEDYDMTLQQLNQYRKVLRLQKYFYEVKQSTNQGGCASQRNMIEEKRQLELLQKKWGSDIVRIDMADRSNNLKKKKRHIDYNPIIKPKIKGV